MHSIDTPRRSSAPLALGLQLQQRRRERARAARQRGRRRVGRVLPRPRGAEHREPRQARQHEHGRHAQPCHHPQPEQLPELAGPGSAAPTARRCRRAQRRSGPSRSRSPPHRGGRGGRPRARARPPARAGRAGAAARLLAAARRERDRTPRRAPTPCSRHRAGALVAHEREHHARGGHPGANGKRQRRRSAHRSRPRAGQHAEQQQVGAQVPRRSQHLPLVGRRRPAVEPPCEHGRDGPAREPPGQADAGQAGGRDPPGPALRAQVGRVPLDRVPRRRRGRDRQPQGAADDALLPRGRRGGPAPLPAARGDRRRDRDRRRRRAGLLGAAAAHPPGRQPRRAARRRDARELRRLRPARARRRGPHARAVRGAPRRCSSGRWPARSRRSTSRRSRATRRSRRSGSSATRAPGWTA